MKTICPFCQTAYARADVIYEYQHWRLFVQDEAKRQETKQAAGFLAARRHITRPVDARIEEWGELLGIMQDATRRLCEYVGVTYTQQETVGFNQGKQAGQTVDHAHVHLLPVAAEDPEEPKVWSGIGGAFEALRRERLENKKSSK